MRTTLPGLGWIEHRLRGGVLVGDRILPPEIKVTFPSDGEQPSLNMTMAVVDGVPQCRSLHIEAKDGGRGVRTSDLRAVALEDLIEQMFAYTATRIIKQEHGVTTSVAEASQDRQLEAERRIRQARRAGKRKVTPEFLERVAQTYRQGIALGRPTETVRQVFGVEHRTAAEYVRRARVAGYLPKTTPGKVRG